MNQEDWLRNYIETTFADVALGAGIDLYAAQSMDDYGNPAEDLLSLAAERNDWRRVPAGDLFPRFWAITFLDAEGFRFYTAAIMTALLVRPHLAGECLSDWFLSNLKVTHAGSVKGVPFNALFSARQRAAIIRFLKYLVHNRPEYRDSDAGRRLVEIMNRT